MGSTLQREVYGQILGGVDFFSKLEVLRKNPRTNPDLLEIYLLCLLNGFRGAYSARPATELVNLVQEVTEEVARRKRDLAGPLSPHPEFAVIGTRGPGGRFWFWLAVSLGAAACLATYLLLPTSVAETARRLYDQVGTYLRQ